MIHRVQNTHDLIAPCKSTLRAQITSPQKKLLNHIPPATLHNTRTELNLTELRKRTPNMVSCKAMEQTRSHREMVRRTANTQQVQTSSGHTIPETHKV